MIAVIAIIVIIAIALAAGLSSGYFGSSTSMTTINEACTIVSYCHPFPYIPQNESTYSYANTTSISAIQTYTQTNIHIQNSSQNVSTVTGNTQTGSGIPGIYWNETVCTFSTLS